MKVRKERGLNNDEVVGKASRYGRREKILLSGQLMDGGETKVRPCPLCVSRQKGDL